MAWIIGNWEVNSDNCTLQCGSKTRRITPRAMEVLVYLAEHSSEAVSVETLLNQFWPNPQVGEHAVYKIITELRHALDEDAKQPKYLKTIPRRGYKLQADQTAVDSSREQLSLLENSSRRLIYAAGAAIVLVAIFAVLVPQEESLLPMTIATIDGKRVGFTITEKDVPPAMVDAIDIVYREAIMRVGELRNTSLETISAPDLVSETFVTTFKLDRLVRFSHFEKSLTLEIIPGVNDTAHLDRFDLSPSVSSTLYVDEIVNRTVTDLDTLLSSAHLDRMQLWGTRDIHAYRYAYQGALHLRYYDVPNLFQARDFFLQAIASDQKFEDAYLNLSNTYSELAFLASDTQSREASKHAMLVLGDDARKANLSEGLIQSLGYDRYAASDDSPRELESRWRERLTSSPRDSETLWDYSKLLSGAGLIDEALRYVDSAVANELDPDVSEAIRVFGYTNVASVTSPAEAVRSAKKVLAIHPNYTITLYGLVENHARIGNYIEAERYLEQLKLSDPDGAWAYSGQLVLSTLKGELPLNSQALDDAIANPKASKMMQGQIYFIVNDVEKGIAAWREMEAGLVHLLWQNYASREDIFDQRVLDDPRYQALMEDFGLGKRWRAYLLKQTMQLADITGIPVTTPIDTPELRFIARFGGDSVSTLGD